MFSPEKTRSKNPGGVYEAADAVRRTLSAMEERRKLLLENRAISGLFGIPEIDEYLVPLWPGQLMYVVALPSNGKSFTVRMFAKRVVDMLLKHGDGKRVAVWVTTEESIEQITAHWLAAMSGISSTAMLSGRLEKDQVTRIENVAVAEVGSWPLYIVGHAVSSRNASGVREKTQRLSRDEIDAAFNYIMNDLGKEISISALDYIHQIRDDVGRDRETHIRESVNWTREVALWTGAPFIAAAQGKSKVFDYSIPLAGIPDVEWSMNAGQSADSMISLFMPKTKFGVGGMIPEFAGFPAIICEDGMMFVSITKQKDGPAGKVFLIRAKPQHMDWELLEVREYDLNAASTAQIEKTPMGRPIESANSWPGGGDQEKIIF